MCVVYETNTKIAFGNAVAMFCGVEGGRRTMTLMITGLKRKVKGNCWNMTRKSVGIYTIYI